MAINEENVTATNHKMVLSVNTQNVLDVGKLTSTLMNLPEIGRVLFDLEISPHEITLYSHKALSIEKIDKIIETHGYKAIYKTTVEL